MFFGHLPSSKSSTFLHLILHVCWHILLYIYNSSVSFFRFAFNFEQSGGAVQIYKGSGTFKTCSFNDNTATDVSTTIIRPCCFHRVTIYIIRRSFFGHLPSTIFKIIYFFCKFFILCLCLPRATLLNGFIFCCWDLTLLVSLFFFFSSFSTFSSFAISYLRMNVFISCISLYKSFWFISSVLFDLYTEWWWGAHLYCWFWHIY